MRNSIITGITLLAACTSGPVGLDDEAGVTTAMSGSSSDSADESEAEAGATFAMEDSTSGTTTSSFVIDFDVMLTSECDSFAQDCPRGEKCVPHASSGGSWDASKCVPVMGDQQPGEACVWGGIVEATDDCDASSICWNVSEVDGELVGTCVAICTGTPDAPMCPPASSCQFASDGVVFVCLLNCNPLVQDCEEGLGCFWTDIDFQCIFTAGEIPTGEPCGFINDCAPGHLCTDAASLPECAGVACCTSYCDLQLGDAGCAGQPGTTCAAFFEQGMAPPEYVNVGVCVLPP